MPTNQDNLMEKPKNKGGRPRKYPEGTEVCGYSLPKDMITRLELEAQIRGVSASSLVTQAINLLFNQTKSNI